MHSGLKSRPMKTARHALFGLALALAALPALADWKEIYRFDDGMRIFVNQTRPFRDGDFAEITHLVRWGEPQTDDDDAVYLSTLVRTRYDCQHKLERYLGSTSYAGQMANGDVVISDDNEADKWYTISEASMEEKLWNVACRRP